MTVGVGVGLGEGVADGAAGLELEEAAHLINKKPKRANQNNAVYRTVSPDQEHRSQLYPNR